MSITNVSFFNTENIFSAKSSDEFFLQRIDWWVYGEVGFRRVHLPMRRRVDVSTRLRVDPSTCPPVDSSMRRRATRRRNPSTPRRAEKSARQSEKSARQCVHTSTRRRIHASCQICSLKTTKPKTRRAQSWPLPLATQSKVTHGYQ